MAYGMVEILNWFTGKYDKKRDSDFDDKKELEIARLNDRIEGMAKDNLNMLNENMKLKRRNKYLNNEIQDVKHYMNLFKKERNVYLIEVKRLKKELSLVI